MIDHSQLINFVSESNRIEGIELTIGLDIDAHRTFLAGPITIPALIRFVAAVRPGARFRNETTVPGVRVGDHVAPKSGPRIESDLREILACRDPWKQHVDYETLHPFTDGNGRSGRAIWLHRHHHEADLDPWAIRRGFLHSFYYQTLSAVPRKSADKERAAEKLREAAQAVVDRKQATFRARNGEMCWIVHSDEIAQLEGALASKEGEA